MHIIEPQWNPSVEAQAIARALRMGQTREVTVVRYVVEKTVEQVLIFGNLLLLSILANEGCLEYYQPTGEEATTGKIRI